jgi:hypothetical protein
LTTPAALPSARLLRNPREAGDVAVQVHKGQELIMLAERYGTESGLNERQWDILALQIAAIARFVGGDLNSQQITLLIGAGGTGKTWVQTALRKAVREVFGPPTDRGVATSNSAARVLGLDATTIHKALSAVRGEDQSGRGVRKPKKHDKHEAEFAECLALCVDEVGLPPASLLYKLMLAICIGRAKQNGCDPGKARSSKCRRNATGGAGACFTE